MCREEILEKLRNIRVGAQPTCITMDMGLQYEYVTPEGYGEGLGNMGEWPVYVIQNITEDFLCSIQKRIAAKELSLEDLEGTDLGKLCNAITEIPRLPGYEFNVCEFLKDLCHIAKVTDNTLYVLCDAGQWEPEVHFFETYDEMEEAFVNYYVTYVNEWESFTDDEITEWLERIQDELDGIPCISFTDE